MKPPTEDENYARHCVACNLKSLRKAARMDQKQMSHALLTKNPKCGLSPKRISDIEINRSATKLHELAAYTAFFDCTMESLFEEPAESPPVPLTIDGRMDSVETRCYDVENRCYEIENRCAQVQSAQIKLNIQRETDARVVAESMNYLEKRCYELEQANTTLKARVDFIVEAINTLQGTVDAPKELFQ
jgi:transcriptional regulator with XRE-family HTH domain